MSEQNPYVSPLNSDKLNPSGNFKQEKKPDSIKVFGILNLVFGALGVCSTLFSGVVLFAMPQDPNMPNPALDLMQSSPAYRGFMIGAMGVGFIFTIIVILSGIGLLKYRKSGRTLALWYAWYAIIAAVVGTVVNIVVLYGPMMAQANQQGGPEAAAAVAGFIGGMVGGIAGLIYPVILLFFMYKKKVIDALD